MHRAETLRRGLKEVPFGQAAYPKEDVSEVYIFARAELS